MATTPPLPTITVDGPQSTPKMTPRPTPLPQSPPSSKRSSPQRVASPTSGTAPLTSWSSFNPRSCYLCDEQNPGDFSPTTKYLEVCELCSRDFCPIHKDATFQADVHICNINHSRYYHECLDQARRQVASHRAASRDAPVAVTVADEGEAEEILAKEGIFPSIGEKERTVWKTAPVSDARLRELETLRSLDAQLKGTKGQRRSTLIETKEVVGADIAV